jgi:Carbohydrate-binding module 48 (Isoamylase N-terminal domain)
MTDREELDPYVAWIVTEARRQVVFDAAVRGRLLDLIRKEPAPRRRSRALGWLVEPRHIVLPPLTTAALAAGLVLAGVLGGSVINRDGLTTVRPPWDGVADARRPEPSPVSVVKFMITAPQANSVSIVGDFNGWDAAATPAVRREDGSWEMFVPLRPGRYVYSFVLDGEHFITDPAAPITPDDGYGRNNSVVVVAGAVS